MVDYSGRACSVGPRGEDASGISDRATSGRYIFEYNSIGTDQDAIANDNASKHSCIWANTNIVSKTCKIAMVQIRETALLENDARVLMYYQLSPCNYRPNMDADWVRYMKSGTDSCVRTDLAAIP
jgi:hypothetical protein